MAMVLNWRTTASRTWWCTPLTRSPTGPFHPRNFSSEWLYFITGGIIPYLVQIDVHMSLLCCIACPYSESAVSSSQRLPLLPLWDCVCPTGAANPPYVKEKGENIREKRRGGRLRRDKVKQAVFPSVHLTRPARVSTSRQKMPTTHFIPFCLGTWWWRDLGFGLTTERPCSHAIKAEKKCLHNIFKPIQKKTESAPAPMNNLTFSVFSSPSVKPIRHQL